MHSPDQTSPTRVRRHRREDSPAHLSKSALFVVCASLLWMVISLGTDPAGSTVRPSGAEHGTHTPTSRSTTTTSVNGNTAVRGHKEGTLAVVFSFIGVIAVVVLIVSLGSISVRRRTRDNPTTVRRPWERGPPDSRRGWFG
jgi:hypothetical protein